MSTFPSPRTHPIGVLRQPEDFPEPLVATFVTPREASAAPTFEWDHDWVTPLTVAQARTLRDSLAEAIRAYERAAGPQ